MSKSFLNQPGLPIGLRNNNPGNLRPTGDQWQGMTGENGGFLVFKDIAYGLRAMGTDIGNKIMLDGLTTLREYIYVYAPPSENDTESYISNMVSYTGYLATQELPHTETALKRLIRGHMNIELGTTYSKLITDTDIEEGLSMMNATLLAYFNINGSSTGQGDNTGLVVGVLAAIALAVGYYYSK